VDAVPMAGPITMWLPETVETERCHVAIDQVIT